MALSCTKSECGSLFVARYEKRDVSPGQYVFDLKACVPRTAGKTAFHEAIVKVSPSFVAIYNEAEAAEAIQLHELVGIGFRKALEFLVKDFAKGERPGEAAEIEKKLLGQCIKEFIDDTNVKRIAERAAWLGNDETHYVRRWLTKDVQDLKKLVGLTVNAIENVLVTKEYLSTMPASGPPAPPPTP
jgi:hypothetical protein